MWICRHGRGLVDQDPLREAGSDGRGDFIRPSVPSNAIGNLSKRARTLLGMVWYGKWSNGQFWETKLTLLKHTSEDSISWKVEAAGWKARPDLAETLGEC